MGGRRPTNLTIGEHPAHLPRNWLIAAEICSTFEDEADIIQEVIPWVRLIVQADREPKDAVRLGRAYDESSTECLRRNDVS